MGSPPSISWEQPLTTSQIRQCAGSWNLATDAGLLATLQAFSDGLAERAAAVSADVSRLLEESAVAAARLETAGSQLLLLSNTRFVESRVQEEEVTVETAPQPLQKQAVPREEGRQATHGRLCRALALGGRLLDTAYERLEVSESESDDPATDSAPVAVEPLDPYLHRLLPHVIASRQFADDDAVGLQLGPSAELPASPTDDDLTDQELDDYPGQDQSPKASGAASRARHREDSREGSPDLYPAPHRQGPPPDRGAPPAGERSSASAECTAQTARPKAGDLFGADSDMDSGSDDQLGDNQLFGGTARPAANGLWGPGPGAAPARDLWASGGPDPTAGPPEDDRGSVSSGVSGASAQVQQQQQLQQPTPPQPSGPPEKKLPAGAVSMFGGVNPFGPAPVGRRAPSEEDEPPSPATQNVPRLKSRPINTEKSLLLSDDDEEDLFHPRPASRPAAARQTPQQRVRPGAAPTQAASRTPAAPASASLFSSSDDDDQEDMFAARLPAGGARAQPGAAAAPAVKQPQAPAPAKGLFDSDSDDDIFAVVPPAGPAAAATGRTVGGAPVTHAAPSRGLVTNAESGEGRSRPAPTATATAPAGRSIFSSDDSDGIASPVVEATPVRGAQGTSAPSPSNVPPDKARSRTPGVPPEATGAAPKAPVPPQARNSNPAHPQRKTKAGLFSSSSDEEDLFAPQRSTQSPVPSHDSHPSKQQTEEIVKPQVLAQKEVAPSTSAKPPEPKPAVAPAQPQSTGAAGGGGRAAPSVSLFDSDSDEDDLFHPAAPRNRAEVASPASGSAPKPTAPLNQSAVPKPTVAPPAPNPSSESTASVLVTATPASKPSATPRPAPTPSAKPSASPKPAGTATSAKPATEPAMNPNSRSSERPHSLDLRDGTPASTRDTGLIASDPNKPAGSAGSGGSVGEGVASLRAALEAASSPTKGSPVRGIGPGSPAGGVGPGSPAGGAGPGSPAGGVGPGSPVAEAAGRRSGGLSALTSSIEQQLGAAAARRRPRPPGGVALPGAAAVAAEDDAATQLRSQTVESDHPRPHQRPPRPVSMPVMPGPIVPVLSPDVSAEEAAPATLTCLTKSRARGPVKRRPSRRRGAAAYRLSLPVSLSEGDVPDLAAPGTADAVGGTSPEAQQHAPRVVRQPPLSVPRSLVRDTVPVSRTAAPAVVPETPIDVSTSERLFPAIPETPVVSETAGNSRASIPDTPAPVEKVAQTHSGGGGVSSQERRVGRSTGVSNPGATEMRANSSEAESERSERRSGAPSVPAEVSAPARGPAASSSLFDSDSDEDLFHVAVSPVKAEVSPTTRAQPPEVATSHRQLETTSEEKPAAVSSAGQRSETSTASPAKTLGSVDVPQAEQASRAVSSPAEDPDLPPDEEDRSSTSDPELGAGRLHSATPVSVSSGGTDSPAQRGGTDSPAQGGGTDSPAQSGGTDSPAQSGGTDSPARTRDQAGTVTADEVTSAPAASSAAEGPSVSVEDSESSGDALRLPGASAAVPEPAAPAGGGGSATSLFDSSDEEDLFHPGAGSAGGKQGRAAAPLQTEIHSERDIPSKSAGLAQTSAEKSSNQYIPSSDQHTNVHSAASSGKQCAPECDDSSSVSPEEKIQVSVQGEAGILRDVDVGRIAHPVSAKTSGADSYSPGEIVGKCEPSSNNPPQFPNGERSVQPVRVTDEGPTKSEEARGTVGKTDASADDNQQEKHNIPETKRSTAGASLFDSDSDEEDLFHSGTGRAAVAAPSPATVATSSPATEAAPVPPQAHPGTVREGRINFTQSEEKADQNVPGERGHVDVDQAKLGDDPSKDSLITGSVTSGHSPKFGDSHASSVRVSENSKVNDPGTSPLESPMQQEKTVFDSESDDDYLFQPVKGTASAETPPSSPTSMSRTELPSSNSSLVFPDESSSPHTVPKPSRGASEPDAESSRAGGESLPITNTAEEEPFKKVGGAAAARVQKKALPSRGLFSSDSDEDDLFGAARTAQTRPVQKRGATATGTSSGRDSKKGAAEGKLAGTSRPAGAARGGHKSTTSQPGQKTALPVSRSEVNPAAKNALATTHGDIKPAGAVTSVAKPPHPSDDDDDLFQSSRNAPSAARRSPADWERAAAAAKVKAKPVAKQHSLFSDDDDDDDLFGGRTVSSKPVAVTQATKPKPSVASSPHTSSGGSATKKTGLPSSRSTATAATSRPTRTADKLFSDSDEESDIFGGTAAPPASAQRDTKPAAGSRGAGEKRPSRGGRRPAVQDPLSGLLG